MRSPNGHEFPTMQDTRSVMWEKTPSGSLIPAQRGGREMAVVLGEVQAEAVGDH